MISLQTQYSTLRQSAVAVIQRSHPYLLMRTTPPYPNHIQALRLASMQMQKAPLLEMNLPGSWSVAHDPGGPLIPLETHRSVQEGLPSVTKLHATVGAARVPASQETGNLLSWDAAMSAQLLHSLESIWSTENAFGTLRPCGSIHNLWENLPSSL